MKKIVNSALLMCTLLGGMAVLTGCHDADDFQKKPYTVTDDERMKYAEQTLGITIDKQQDWVLYRQVSMRITADADLKDITEVAVLDGNPYVDKTQRLARLQMANGGSGTLEFTAPLSSKMLYAACFTADNQCVARPFWPGTDTEMSFVDEVVDEDMEESATTRTGWTDGAERVNDRWQTKNFSNKYLDLPSVQAEAQAFLPQGKDNRQQVAKVNNFHKVWGEPYDIPQHVELVYISGTRTNKDVHVGYQVSLRYDNPDNQPPQTFLVVDNIDPTNYYTYEEPYYQLPDLHLRFYYFPNPDTKRVVYKFTDQDMVEFFAANESDNTAGDAEKVVMFKVNNHIYLACESDNNWDYNDKMFFVVAPLWAKNVPDAGVKPTPPTPQVWTYAWEDKDFGDYDMNDCVIRVQEHADDASKITVTLVALGGTRNLWLGFDNKSAKTYQDYTPVVNKELHEVLGVKAGTMVNTGRSSADPVVIYDGPKPAGFDFQTCSFVLGAMQKDDQQGVYESDYYYIPIATKGQDPHGIVIPGEWQWPTEATCIKDAYPEFNTWASDHTKATDWYLHPVEGKVMKK